LILYGIFQEESDERARNME